MEELLNPLAFKQKFCHITEQIFEQLDIKSISNCREVSKSWRKCIDDKNQAWIHIVKIPEILDDGDTYIHLVARTGQLEMFQKMLKKERAKNPDNKYKETPFILACQYGHFKIANMYFENSSEFKINPNARVQKPVKRGVDSEEHSLDDNWTAFHHACCKGNSKVVQLLIQKSLDNNIDLDAKDSYGMTPFHWACRRGQSEVTKMLIQHSTKYGIDLNSKDNSGRTAFHFACEQNYCEKSKLGLVEMLLNYSATYNIDLSDKIKNDFYSYPLLAKSNFLKLISVSMTGSTAFHVACCSGQSEIVQLLIKRSTDHKIDLNAKNSSGWTGFHLACGFGHTEIVEMLIDNSEACKLDLSAKEYENGRTGIQLAEYLENTSLVNLIKGKLTNENQLKCPSVVT